MKPLYSAVEFTGRADLGGRSVVIEDRAYDVFGVPVRVVERRRSVGVIARLENELAQDTEWMD